MSRTGLRAFFTAILVAFASADARAGVVRRTFQVGAVVIASARLSSTMQASGAAIEIRAAGHRSAPAALLVDGEVKIVESAVILPIPPNGAIAVTVLY